jgi:hypothetical protein
MATRIVHRGPSARTVLDLIRDLQRRIETVEQRVANLSDVFTRYIEQLDRPKLRKDR